MPSDFVPWRRGVTCTVRPEWFAPLDTDRTYLANVTVQRSAPLDEPSADYGALYERATAIVQRHLLDRAGTAEVRTWIQAHAWFRIDLPSGALVSATVTLGLSANKAREIRVPEGEAVPSAEDLRRPSGQSQESFAARHHDESGRRRVDHLYTDFERTGGWSRDVTVSYGEYAGDASVDFESFVRRAERCVASFDSSLEVLLREWRTIRTDKQSDLPWMLAMESHLRRP